LTCTVDSQRRAKGSKRAKRSGSTASLICGDFRDSQCTNTALSNDIIECAGSVSCQSSAMTSNTPTEGYVKCSGSASCEGGSINNTNDVFCNGYQSCNDATSISAVTLKCAADGACSGASISVNNKLDCTARYACSGATITSQKDVNCGGYHACQSANINADGDVNCDGDNSCAYAKITASGTVTCSTFQSCKDSEITAGVSVKLYGAYSLSSAFAEITSTPLVEVYGFAALSYSDINSGSLSEMTVKLLNTGNAATEHAGRVVCAAGAVCNLICGQAGCKGFFYLCQSGATCNIEPAGCSSNSGGTVNNIACPKIITSSSKQFNDNNDDKDDDDDEKIHDIDIVADAKKNCNRENQCDGDNINNDGSVACQGLGSCKNTVINMNATSKSPFIGCFAESSCDSSTLFALYGDVLCQGEASCKSTNRIRGGQVLCSGYQSCADSSDIQVLPDGQFHCTGAQSCSSSNINCHAISVSCLGNAACSDSTINNNGKWGTSCHAPYSCENAKIISSVGGGGSWVSCHGVYACKSATISPTASGVTIYSRGYLSATLATIYGKDNQIIGYGYQSFAYSTIDSNNEATIVVKLFAYQAGYGATLICRGNSVCTLDCIENSCENMDYICPSTATCNITPSKCIDNSNNQIDGVICPNILNNINNDDEINRFLEQKKIERENEKLYKQIFSDIIGNDQLLLFEENHIIQKSITTDIGSILLTMISLFVMIGLVYLVYKIKNNNDDKKSNEYKPLLN